MISRLERAAPWLLGALGTCLFVAPLFGRLSGTILDRTFWYDALILVDARTDFLRNLAEGPGGRALLDWIYAGSALHPQPRALATSELPVLWAIATAPLPPVLAYNVSLSAALVLDVVAGAAFARALGARPISAAVAGLAFTFTSYASFSSGRSQLLFYFPAAFALAALVRWSRTQSIRDGAALALWSAAQALSCLYYAMFLALLLPPLALVIVAAGRGADRWRALLRLALTGAAIALPVGLFLLPYRSMSRVGLAHRLGEVVEQSGDPMMFLWADRATPFSRVIPDIYQWDTAWFPGAVAASAGLLGVAIWARRSRARVGALVAFSLSLLGSRWAGFWLACVAMGALVTWLVVEARAGRTGVHVPLLGVLACGALFLFLGPAPRAWTHPIGTSPYRLLYDHLPFVAGIRMTRRAGVLLQLALAGAAAIALTRIEARRHGRVLVLAAGLLVLAEGIPRGVHARAVATTCTDRAYLALLRQGGRVAGETAPTPFADGTRSTRRHEAMVCGVTTNLGQAAFQPAIVTAAADAIESLPDPVAHARLADAGFDAVILRSGGDRAWLDARLEALRPVTRASERAGPDAVVLLADPGIVAASFDRPFAGRRVKPTSLAGSGRDFAFALDGRDETRWTTGAVRRGGESLVLQLPRAQVVGLAWENHGFPTDVPVSLRIEALGPDGDWQDWADFPAISMKPLGREAIESETWLPLPPREVERIRVTSSGASRHWWLSASELRVIAANP